MAPLVLLLLSITSLLGPNVQQQSVQQVESTVASPYGSAGSFVVILLWIYCAALLFFVGAEITQTYARFHGRSLQPEPYAEETPQAKEKEAKAKKRREQPEPVGHR